MGSKKITPATQASEPQQVAEVEPPIPQLVKITNDKYVTCPSFDDEPWKSRADALRPKSLADYTSNITLGIDTTSYQPVPTSHAYVKLILEFLNSTPKECWIDEENEDD